MSKILQLPAISKFLQKIFLCAMHSKTLESLTFSVYGTLFSERLSSSSIGRALAKQTDRLPKHCIKQVDRLLGNDKFDLIDCFPFYIEWVLGQRTKIEVSLDWTIYGAYNQHRIALNLITSHGRATPLLWKTYPGKSIKNNRENYERALLQHLKEIIGSEISVTVLADRGFSDTGFYKFISKDLKWDCIIRIRKNVYVYSEMGERKVAHEWLYKNGRLHVLNNARISAKTRLKLVRW